MKNSSKVWMMGLMLLSIVAIAACAPTGSSQQASQAPAAAGEKTKLADEPYAQFAYLISGDTLDSAAQTALTGFEMQKTANPDGTTTIKLNSSNPEYQDQSYTLKQGEQLYFIERSLGDDRDDYEHNLRDDFAVVVDADGYVVSQ